ncbi:MAG: hypothetical protein ABH865_08695 [Candidatus Omnitrophota bacterium]|nr:hypothetical protein [Candidatus Omnitrophota bacterium]
MVTLQERLFLITGPQFSQRQRALEVIKKKVFRDLSAFNLLTFYADDIELNDFSEKVLTVSFEGARIILIRDALRLSAEVRQFIFENIKKIILSNCIALEVEKEYKRLQEEKKITTDTLFGLFFAQATILKTAPALDEQVTFETFKTNLFRRDLPGSLYALQALFSQRTRDDRLGLQILGLLISAGAQERDPGKKEKKMIYLWEADRAIKEKGIDSQTVLSVALTKILNT